MLLHNVFGFCSNPYPNRRFMVLLNLENAPKVGNPIAPFVMVSVDGKKFDSDAFALSTFFAVRVTV